MRAGLLALLDDWCRDHLPVAAAEADGGNLDFLALALDLHRGALGVGGDGAGVLLAEDARHEEIPSENGRPVGWFSGHPAGNGQRTGEMYTKRRQSTRAVAVSPWRFNPYRAAAR